MRSQTDRMLRLIEDLLTLSALESTALPARETAIDVQALLRAIARGGARALGRAALDQLELGPAATLWGDERESAQRDREPGVERGALHAEATAASRSTGASGTARGCIARRRHRHRHRDRATSPRLTERFYRVDTSRSRDTGGTGLGLAIVKHVLTRHQARLEVTSELGKGSRFAAVFPAAAREVATASGGGRSGRRTEKLARS